MTWVTEKLSYYFSLFKWSYSYNFEILTAQQIRQIFKTVYIFLFNMNGKSIYEMFTSKNQLVITP
jgi:hypothetical protein